MAKEARGREAGGEGIRPVAEAQPLKITYLPLDGLEPYSRNSRTHSPVQIAKLKRSLLQFGWTTPIALADRGILAGHARRLAARELRDAGEAIPGNPDPDKAPTVDLSHLDPDQRRAYVIADNRLALDAGWDNDMLLMELGELRENGFDLALTGFDTSEIEALIAGALPAGNTDPDDAPPAPVHPVTEPGDVWLLGKHRILCGDSTSADDVERVLAGVKPHLMCTDPPYGVKYDPNWRNEAERASGQKVGARAVGKVMNDDRADWREAWALFPGNVAYVWCAPGALQYDVFASLKATKFTIRQHIVWVKTRPVLGRGHYHYQHENAWYAVREGEQDGWQERFEVEHEMLAYAVRDGKTGEWHGGRKQSTVWYIEHLKSDTGHGTQKPVEAMKRPIENNSSPGQAVYEPFAGSSTTIIACEITGRVCYALELSPAYVDVGVLRWQAFTGKQAVHETTGLTFDEMAKRRPYGDAAQAPSQPDRDMCCTAQSG